MFRPSFMLTLALVLGLVLAACAQSPGQSSSQSTAGEPAASQASGGGDGGGGGGGQYGSAVFEISGNVEASGELPFQPAGSVFADGAWYMTFAEENGNQVLAINLVATGMTVLYGDGSITAVGIGSGTDGNTCDFNIDHQDAGGSSGSFDCANASGTNAAGAVFADGVEMHGTWDARAN